MRLVKASEMQEMDRKTIQDVGIPGAVLMENAARSATKIFLNHFDCARGARVLLLCGRGNNGGDGYVMARYLYEMGCEVHVIVLTKRAPISGDARINLDIIDRLGLPILEVPDLDAWQRNQGLIEASDFIIDGILGTGLNTPVRGFYKEVIETVNVSDRPVMAVDIPSGLNADTGQVMGTSINADLTVTFGLPKVGQLIFPGAALVGRLVCVNIGIPGRISKGTKACTRLIEPSDFEERLKNEKRDIHKGNRGHLLVLAGSPGKTGAAALTASGALRAGAGLVTVGIPRGLNSVLECKLTEAMTAPLPETSSGCLSMASKPEIEALMEGKTALAIGPGLSTDEETVALVRQIIGTCPLPMVIDADGLNAIAGVLPDLIKGNNRIILTPHPGEMSRLTGLETSEIQRARPETALRFVQEQGCFLVLKGARTLVAEPEGDLWVNPTGNQALSSGGTGDVLTGLIGGFLARGWPSVKAGLAGVYIHGLAADHLAESFGETGIVAGELLDVIPHLASSIARGEWPLKEPPLHADLYHPI